MADAFTPNIDPATGDATLDDGELEAAPSAALGLALWTLRTPYGACPVCPELGVRWSVAQTNTGGAANALKRELERALRWIEEAGFLANLAVSVTTPAPRRIQYEVAFDDAETGRRRTLRGAL